MSGDLYKKKLAIEALKQKKKLENDLQDNYMSMTARLGKANNSPAMEEYLNNQYGRLVHVAKQNYDRLYQEIETGTGDFGRLFVYVTCNAPDPYEGLPQQLPPELIDLSTGEKIRRPNLAGQPDQSNKRVRLIRDFLYEHLSRWILQNTATIKRLYMIDKAINTYIDQQKQGGLSEATFRKSKKFVHVVDVPMFSIFVDATLSTINIRYTERAIKKKLDEFTQARNEIHKIGFPSMHANVVITDLSGEQNSNTGEGGVAGQAIDWNRGRFMKVDRNNIASDVIVHEWAHIWLFNNSKDFKQSIKNLYAYMTRHAASKITTATAPEHLRKLDNDDERKVLDTWVKAFIGLITWGLKEPDVSLYVLKNRKFITYDMLRYLPHRFTINAVLTQPIHAESFRHNRKTLC